MSDGPLFRAQGMPVSEVDINLEFRGGTFTDAIRFSNSRLGNITISGGVFEGPVTFERGVYNTITITGGEFRKGIFFGSNELNFDDGLPTVGIRDNIRPWTSNTDGIFSRIMLSTKSECTVSITNSLVKDNITIDTRNTEIALIDVTSQQSTEIRNGKVSISGGAFDTLKIGKIDSTSRIELSMSAFKVNHLMYEGLLSKESSVATSNLTINSARFERFVNQGNNVWNKSSLISTNLALTNMTVLPDAQRFNKRFYYYSAFHHFNTQTWLDTLQTYEPALQDLPPTPQTNKPASIEILNSDLGKTTLISCTLDAQCTFVSSKLIELSIIDTIFPISRWSPVTNFSQQRSALFQLVKVYETSGDYNTARDIKVAELEAYRMELGENGISEESITLDLNHASNNHGQSWSKALIWLLGIGFALWLSVIPFFSIGVPDEETGMIVFQSFGYFLEFLNPVHRFGLMEEYAIKVAGYTKDNIPEIPLAFSNIVDTIWRIFSAYLVYQLVFAFRRHGRR